MVVVSPCRSDMSAHGLAPWAHLADGRLTLVLVRECSTLRYLRFLTSIPRRGARACGPALHGGPSRARAACPPCLSLFLRQSHLIAGQKQHLAHPVYGASPAASSPLCGGAIQACHR